jgi:hypothetical protein
MVAWIMTCITSSSFSMSINGNVHGYFRGKRGLRQGDPISPYIFTMVMEILTLILQHDVRIDSSFKFHNRCEKQKIINLCFADDLFLFARADRGSVDCVLNSLSSFTCMSGLVPNIHKSTVFFANVPDVVRSYILTKMPFAEGALPVKYLGVPLISSRLSYRHCGVLLELLDNRILSRKNRFLSFAGRLQLIISVLSSMHIFWSSVFVLPARVIKELEAKMRNFLWSHGKYLKGKAKVAWKDVCRPKVEGGLGIRRIDDMNKAQMASLIWRIVSNQNSLWVRWIHSYRLKGRTFWDCNEVTNCCWSWRKLLQLRPRFRQFFWTKIGDGRTTSAWYDNWADCGPLCRIISSRNIYGAGFSTKSCVADIIVDGDWHIPREWRGKYPMTFTTTPPLLDHSKKDSITWKVGNNIYPYSGFLAWESIRERVPQVRWCNVVWFSKCIPKHAFMLWLIIQGKLVTQDKLRIWNFKARNDLNMMCCLLCYSDLESHTHLFFECHYSAHVWKSVRSKKGMIDAPPVLESILSKTENLGKSNSLMITINKLVVAASAYHIWRERNLRFANNKFRSPDVVVSTILEDVRLKLLNLRVRHSTRIRKICEDWGLEDSRIFDDGG